ncbi:hypothetical protein J1N35_004807 [Gossypium stocksii]|uniref:Uncharacterized protein n=1 Tax=Gossypium stocksii TaxID=47602 RepID=A0A9D3WCP8_9ROSI|nr:hypothetical protein J1N35_004807 [Gossypium stocksii]
MHNVDLLIDDALEFPDLPHRKRDHTSSSLDSGELEVGKEFSSKDGFLGVLNQYSNMNEVNHHVVKSKSKKFEANQLTIKAQILSVTYLSINGKLQAGIVVIRDQLLLVGVGRMTHLNRTKIAEVFVSPTTEVFESQKTMGIRNEMSFLTVLRAVPPTTMPIYH